MNRPRRIANIVGARPNLVKMTALLAAQRARPGHFEPLLIHTGQHRDPAMSKQLIDELELPTPDVMLGGGHGGGAAVEAMTDELRSVLARLRPDMVLVVGDVNSTAAGALAARELSLPLAHVEAGLRSFDLDMPEERNRILVDSLSDHLFASEESAVDNLRREGYASERIHHVGNVMIDALVRFHPRAAERNPAGALGIAGPYAVLTLHRPSNVDKPASLAAWLNALRESARQLPIVFPVHPRTRDRIKAAGFAASLADIPGLHAVPPMSYLDMLALMNRAAVVITDSGGVQEETTYLGVPCLTVRDATERPATVTHGTNRVIGAAPDHLSTAIGALLRDRRAPARRPHLWDGSAAPRIAAVLGDH